MMMMGVLLFLVGHRASTRAATFKFICSKLYSVTCEPIRRGKVGEIQSMQKIH